MALSAASSKIVRIDDDTEFMQVSDRKWKYFHCNFTKVSAKMYDYNCDVKLQVQQEVFRAHRTVLSDASDYFDAMFSVDMRERDQDSIELRDLSPQGVTAMLEYFYHGHVTVEHDTVSEVLEAARFFHIDWLVSVCCHYLVHGLAVENFDIVMTLADKFVLGDLRSEIFKFISVNFTELASKPKFCSMSYELLHQLLDSDIYIDADESVILRAVLNWVTSDLENRKPYRRSLLEKIRFCLLDPHVIDDLDDDVIDTPALRQLVAEALEYHGNPGKQCLMTSARTAARGGESALVLMSAVDDVTLIQYKLPGKEGFFQERTNTGGAQSLFEFSSMCVLGNFLFVAGGYDRYTYCSSPAVYRWDPRRRHWTQLTSMRCPRVSFALCAGAAGLHAVAGIEHIVESGRDVEIKLPSIEHYDPVTDTWTEQTPLPIGYFSLAAVVYEGTLYVCGGISDDPQDTVPVNYLYALRDREMTSLPPMRVERHGHAAAAVAGKLYVCGGYTAKEGGTGYAHCATNEMYDIAHAQWTTVSAVEPNVGHIHPACALLDGQLYVIGGKTEHRFLHGYDRETDTVEDGEYCGMHVNKLVAMTIAIPLQLLNGVVDEEDDPLLSE